MSGTAIRKLGKSVLAKWPVTELQNSVHASAKDFWESPILATGQHHLRFKASIVGSHRNLTTMYKQLNCIVYLGHTSLIRDGTPQKVAIYENANAAGGLCIPPHIAVVP